TELLARLRPEEADTGGIALSVRLRPTPTILVLTLGSGEVKQRMSHLVVLPAYNEQACLAKTVASLENLPEDFELLVVDDGSTDRTALEAERLARQSQRKLHIARLAVNCGIGAAVQTGYVFAASRDCYRYVVQFDADGQHDATFIPALIKECEE